jgi:predicted O-methyltransferase YrrM
MVTPLLGGSPAVWNTSMVFFQGALLIGYFYAHALQKLRSLSTQVIVHACALLLACVVLPLAPSTLLGTPNVQQPTLWLLGVLLLSVGAPYMVASATAPLLQAWYARTGRYDAADPYYLYGASNLGSLLGLLAYPVLVEPNIGVRGQSVGWSWAYVGVIALVLASGLTAVVASKRARAAAAGATDADIAHTGEGNTLTNAHNNALATAPTTIRRQRLFWLAAAAVPSSLLIGVTQHILTDIASAPFLWVPPLVLYLLTFVVAFRKGAKQTSGVMLSLHAGFVTLVVVLPKSPSIWLDVALRLVTLFIAALVCHAALAASRPPTSRLTEYYNFMSLGGVIGGAATALLAPMLFNGIVEFPLALAATMLFRPRHDVEWKWVANTILVFAAAGIISVTFGWLEISPQFLAVAAFAVYLNRGRPVITIPVIVATMVLVDARLVGGEQLLRTRTFFGAYRVVEIEQNDERVRMLMHGSTQHGLQFSDTTKARIPLSYYAEGGSLYEAVRAALPVGREAQGAFIGLGSGAMACVMREGDSTTFIEIDPAVARIAQDPRYFSYLDKCPSTSRVLLGDGRLEMERMAPASLDVVLADAFSSDAIPTHLLTREAVRIYMRALRPGGVLVLHVSNRHLAVVNEAVRVAREEGLSARLWRSGARITGSRSRVAASASAVLVTHSESAMSALQLGAHWKAPPVLDGRAWSDDFINLLRTMRERPLDTLPTPAIP